MALFRSLFRSEPFENLQICFEQACDNEADCPFSDQCRLDPDSCEVTIDNETLDFTNFTIKGKTRREVLSKAKLLWASEGFDDLAVGVQGVLQYPIFETIEISKINICTIRCYLWPSGYWCIKKFKLNSFSSNFYTQWSHRRNADSIWRIWTSAPIWNWGSSISPDGH